MKFIYLLGIIGTIAGGSIMKYQPKHTTERSAEGFVIDTLARGLTVPWEIIFLPDKTMMFSERNGKIRLYRNNKLLPGPALVLNEIDTTKKMGLLGICIHPEFNRNRYVYLSHNYKKGSQALLKVLRYKLINDSLIQPTLILDDIFASLNHTGCRLKFGPDGKLYITTGDADRPILAQDLKSLNGKILRVNDDGTIPKDNPFISNDTARKEIWTYGHRNPQGIDFQPGTGQMFNSEHGPTGGDEINLIQKGSNYGWPLVHHQDKRDGMISPLLEYTPSIGPSQVAFYTTNAFPALRGKLLLACLRGEKIISLQVEGDKIISQQNLIESAYGRIRALTIGPDGFIYFSTSQNDPPEGRPRQGYDMVLRIRPGSVKLFDTRNMEIRNETRLKAKIESRTPALIYRQLCAGCHGNNLEGTEKAKALLNGKWKYGATKMDITKNIREGIIEKGMPAWEGSLTEKEIESVANFIWKRSGIKKTNK